MTAPYPRHVTAFDETVDVIVVGYGFAGAVSAIAAHDAGAQVLLLEKMADPGGISVCAGGGLRLSRDREAAFAYLKATNDGTTPDDVIRAFVDGMFEVEDFVAELVKVNGAESVRVERPGNYPFPGHDSMYFLEIDNVPGFDRETGYPHARSLRNGTNLMKVLEDNVNARRGIAVRLSAAAGRLITGEDGAVRGLWAEGPDGPRSIGARQGVILACGGFEANPEMQRQYWQLNPVLSAAFRGNTGDGIRMASDVGADLWHMWHFHGSYGFRHPDPGFPFAIRMKRLPDWVPDVRETDAVMSWILLDRTGRRFMNEYEPYLQDTGHRPLDVMDPAIQRQPFVPCYAVVDEVGRQMYPLGGVVFNDRDVTPYEWSDDNLAEVQNGILTKCSDVAELAAAIGCEVGALEASLEAWNAACAAGQDSAHNRPSQTMAPIATPPFYVGEIWPVVSNTQGGPVHDAQQRVLNAYGEPIQRLYEAGEVGSIWGHLYLSGANLSECFIGGRIAGREVAALESWEG
ncbi:MAG: FAD-binding protein [Alphaproteobacteria bacterium]|nr:FAD-binding protein [Alphaproteobacteria bacterium]